jgi:hypothetical protein
MVLRGEVWRSEDRRRVVRGRIDRPVPSVAWAVSPGITGLVVAVKPVLYGVANNHQRPAG